MPTIMAQEIAEQPAAIAATLEALRPLRARIAQLAQNCQQILFVARGSSDNAAYTVATCSRCTPDGPPPWRRRAWPRTIAVTST